MENLKLSDVWLRGCGFTLYPAANQCGVDEDIAHRILFAIYSQHGMNTNEDTLMATILSPTDFGTFVDQIQVALQAGLLYQVGNDYHLSTKMITILQEAAKIQQKLDEEGFHCCPCHSCY